MLIGLDIRDMLIIERLELSFQGGLNVLTGETGAGKSILLDCLGFVLGWRGRAELVRKGADQGEVTAEFYLGEDHPARAILKEAGLPEGDELILRRVNRSDGRKTAWVNDRRVSGDVLRSLSQHLVELHGQHDDRGLLDPRGHMRLLDEFARNDKERRACRSAWADWREARSVLSKAEEALEKARQEEEFLRHASEELTTLDPQSGEEAALDTRRRLMQNAEKLRENIGRAEEALGGQGAESFLHDAHRWLEDAQDELGEAAKGPVEAISRALVELGEAQDGVSRLLDEMRFDPGELEQVEERLFAIRGLARKHGVLPDALVDLNTELSNRLAVLDGGAEEIASLRSSCQQAEETYRKAAQRLTEKRVKAASALDKAMKKELGPLKLDRAVFVTEVTSGEAGPDGQDQVSFTVATNPGTPTGPLSKIASGGELSRFLLALKVCLMRGAGDVTMIFDEIDRGVGGATANAVGRRLSALSQGAQILVVTHSPQVAALGAHHWRVEKQVRANQTLSQVVSLSETDRVDEIARMLSGDTVSDAARDAARALLDQGNVVSQALD